VPRTAASVSTRVVSWKDAAEMNDSVASEALVMPSSTGLVAAGCSLRDCGNAVLLEHAHAIDLLAAQVAGIAGSEISTLRSIWRMIVSMCLSLIFTPCRR
jgi:hypothetical protein